MDCRPFTDHTTVMLCKFPKRQHPMWQVDQGGRRALSAQHTEIMRLIIALDYATAFWTVVAMCLQKHAPVLLSR